MRLSQYYIPTKRDVSKADSINAYLLDKAGYVQQVASGLYNLLPLGLKTVSKIEQIIREEMNAIGGSEVQFSALQPVGTWKRSGRWDDDNFRSIVYQDESVDMTFGATHEEPMVIAVKEKVQSYRDLPVTLYQFQTKFRKELRAKSGLLRGREFKMKDLYSFHPTVEAHNEFYEQVAGAYTKIFKRLGLESYRVKASGGVFSKEYSDEFQVICPTGEDEILVDRSSYTGFNKEVEADLPVEQLKSLERVKAIEVGNIFHLGSKYSDAFNLTFLDQDGKRQPVVMGSYGIGVTRLLGTIAELYNDEHGLLLPLQLSPFAVYLADLNNLGESVYNKLCDAGIEVLWDDRSVPAGAKLVDADLTGFPFRVVTSDKAGDKVELRRRGANKTELISVEELIKICKK